MSLHGRFPQVTPCPRSPVPSSESSEKRPNQHYGSWAQPGLPREGGWALQSKRGSVEDKEDLLHIYFHQMFFE